MKKNPSPVLTAKGCAALAAMDAGIYNESAFEKFWELYLTNLADKQHYVIDYLAEMLKQEREERASERAKQRIYHLKLALTFAGSSLIGMFLTLLFGL